MTNKNKNLQTALLLIATFGIMSGITISVLIGDYFDEEFTLRKGQKILPY